MERVSRLWCPVVILLLIAWASAGYAHDVAETDKLFVQSVDGPAIWPFLYLGAKHMVTGYDHILFLIGVVFFLYRLKDVVLYVSIFTVGHSTTLLLGVLLGIGANAHLVDAIIGLSVVYKGVENIGGFRKLGFSINTKVMVFVFGLFHGLGLATKLMDLAVSKNGLLANLIAFNAGVEIGQVIVLVAVVSLLNIWRGRSSFEHSAAAANIFLIIAGLALTGYQLTRYFAA